MPIDPALRNRLTFGPIMLIGLIAVLLFDGWFERQTAEFAARRFEMAGGIGGLGLMALLVIVLPIGVRELAELFTAERVRPYRFIAGAGVTCLIVHAFLTQFPPFTPYATPSLALIIVATMLFAALRRGITRETDRAIVSMAGTLLATMYIGGLAWFLVALRVRQADVPGDYAGSTSYVVLTLLCVKFTDIGAYFTGKAFGRHKLIRWLSPGKTWEGLAGGLLTATTVGVLFGAYLLDDLPWPKAGLFGCVIGGVGQLGDLLESLMKRDAEMKDSGSSIPGFGGVLDVIDSPLLASPFAYLLLRAM